MVLTWRLFMYVLWRFYYINLYSYNKYLDKIKRVINSHTWDRIKMKRKFNYSNRLCNKKKDKIIKKVIKIKTVNMIALLVLNRLIYSVKVRLMKSQIKLFLCKINFKNLLLQKTYNSKDWEKLHMVKGKYYSVY